MKRSRPLRRKVSIKAKRKTRFEKSLEEGLKWAKGLPSKGVIVERHPLKRSKPMRRVGKVGRKGICDRREARQAYVRQFNPAWPDEAFCQSCRRVIKLEDSCFSHKIPRGRKPGNEPHRGIYSCWPCNTFADLKKEYRDALIASKADMNNGLAVEWTEKQRQELNTYIQKYEGLW